MYISQQHLNNIYFYVYPIYFAITSSLWFIFLSYIITASEHKTFNAYSNKYLSSIDVLVVCGNHKGNHNNDKDHRQHYSTMKNIYKNIININKIRPLPVYFHCYGYEIIINILIR